MRRTARIPALLLIAVAAATACAPKTAPPPSSGALRYPDYVYPAPPIRVGDARTRARLTEGWNRLQAGDLAGADASLGELARQQPDFYPAAVGLGYVALAQGRPKDALARFDRVAARAARYGPALAGRGEALLAAGQRDAALEAFEAALAADASLADLRRRIDALTLDRFQDRIAAAKKAADAGRLDEARDGYAAAIALSPDTAFLYRDLGAVELRRKRPAEAESAFRKAVTLDPSDARAHAGLASALEERGNVDGALAALERAYALEPTEALKTRIDRLRERDQASGLPPEFAAIPAQAQLTRGDLAALVGIRLRTVVAASKSRTSVVATDVRGHWASRWIMDVIRAGVMDVLPNHTFQPHAVVRRSELAQTFSRLLTISGAAPGRAERSRVSMADVGAGHLSYDDIATTVAAGVLALDGGNFRPSRAVTGQEAAGAIGRLERIVLRARGGSR
jgi:tetratricopeptide (TPR) repeat protein